MGQPQVAALTVRCPYWSNLLHCFGTGSPDEEMIMILGLSDLENVGPDHSNDWTFMCHICL